MDLTTILSKIEHDNIIFNLSVQFSERIIKQLTISYENVVIIF